MVGYERLPYLSNPQYQRFTEDFQDWSSRKRYDYLTGYENFLSNHANHYRDLALRDSGYNGYFETDSREQNELFFEEQWHEYFHDSEGYNNGRILDPAFNAYKEDRWLYSDYALDRMDSIIDHRQQGRTFSEAGMTYRVLYDHLNQEHYMQAFNKEKETSFISEPHGYVEQYYDQRGRRSFNSDGYLIQESKNEDIQDFLGNLESVI